MAPGVVIEMAAPDRDSPHARALVESCTRGVREGPCALAKKPADSEPLGALAIVAWSAGHRVARIEVGIRRADRAEWLSRKIEFGPADAEVERWRAVGLVIATLVGDVRAALEAPKAAAPPPAAPPPAPVRDTSAPPRPAPIRHDTFWFDAAAVVATALDDGVWQVGPSVRASAAPLRFPVFGSVSGRWSIRPTDGSNLGVQWWSFSIGVGVSLSPVASVPVRVEPRAELALQHTRASVVEAGSGASDAEGRWTLGGRLAADAVWAPGSRFGAFVGAEASIFPGTTEVLVRGRPLARQPALGVAGQAGPRVRF
jgi:hypothetical protein